jgi:D-glycero-alpha-D-manno-heptose 1-phosphate guanylyltransferase
MHAVILAGGLGTRLREVVSDLPKAMAPIGDKPFLYYLLKYWLGQGIQHFVISVGYKHELIQEYFGDLFQGVPITYAIEAQPLGTGGGLLNALEYTKTTENILILNGDTLFEVDLNGLVNSHLQSKADLTITLRKSTDMSRYHGITVNKDGYIKSLSTPASNNDKSYINGGAYLAIPEVFTKFMGSPSRIISLEEEIFSTLLAEEHEIYGFISDGIFIDIGIPEDYQRAEAFVNAMSL